ncbi:hypothetical protein [Bradyrhizobium cenepequi]|uniref:hypothetical protein n=1 Tax=Bradyrhizobium cenepequi TaxID=2821403 RepID=UPI001CE3B4D1|nr:hypothetical protein [Bradyrhizobium cenepequi]MCA6108102.1 hypothetical protein [Bradyrhizobium cenepequi]
MFDPADMFAANIGFWIGGLVGGALVWHFKNFFVNVGRKVVSWFKGHKYLVTAAENDIKAAVAAVEAKIAALKNDIAVLNKPAPIVVAPPAPAAPAQQ